MIGCWLCHELRALIVANLPVEEKANSVPSIGYWPTLKWHITVTKVAAAYLLWDLGRQSVHGLCFHTWHIAV